MSMPDVNQELFGKVYNQITQAPEAHNQDVWESEYSACGTVRCTAGWALYFTHPEDQTIYKTIQRDAYVRLGFEGAGKMLLGLTSAEANYLFYSDNDEALDMIAHYAEHGREGFTVPVRDE